MDHRTPLEKELDAIFAEEDRVYLASPQYQEDRALCESLGWICDDDEETEIVEEDVEFLPGDVLKWAELPVQIPWKCDMNYLTRMVGEIRGDDVIIWMVIERRPGR